MGVFLSLLLTRENSDSTSAQLEFDVWKCIVLDMLIA